MGFFSNVKTDRIITEIRGCTDPSSPATQKLVAKLKDGGEDAILPIVAALPDADKPVTAALVEALSALVNQKSFPKFILAMVQGSPKVVAGVKQALAASRAYPPHMLLEALNKEDNPRSALLDVVVAQKARFGVRELLNAAATARFEPARVAGAPVSFNVVWLVTHTTVRAPLRAYVHVRVDGWKTL